MEGGKGLVTNYGEGGGGATKTEGGGACEGRAEQGLAMLMGGGGHKQFWGCFGVVA